MKNPLKLLLKIAFVALLLYFLGQKGFLSLKNTGKALTQYSDTVPALLALILTSLLGVVRWQWLLQAQGIHLPLKRVTQLSFVGMFFNIALPGAVSGDFVKAFYVGKEIQGQRARAFGSILFDRVAGLSALVILSAGALAIHPDSTFNVIKIPIILAALWFVFFYAYLFLVREHHDPLLRLFKAVELKIPRTGTITRIYEGLRHYHNHRVTVVKVLALSLFVHMIVGWMFLRFSHAMETPIMDLVSLYVVVPLGLLVTAIPIMPAGVGTGHAAFLFLFHLLGNEKGADVFTLYALANIFVCGVLGGLVYLQFRGHEPKPDFEVVSAPQS